MPQVGQKVEVGPLKIEVVAYQWGWKYRLPGGDGILGKTDIKYITDENPFGLIAEDKNGMDDLLVDSEILHLEIDKPVKFELRTIDVAVSYLKCPALII